jgi:hypothetical protein
MYTIHRPDRQQIEPEPRSTRSAAYKEKQIRDQLAGKQSRVRDQIATARFTNQDNKDE